MQEKEYTRSTKLARDSLIELIGIRRKLGYGGDNIGKMIVITFADNEEEVADQVVSALMDKGNFEYMERTVEKELYFRGLTIYPDKREVYHRGKEAGLTFTQFEILHILARSPGRVFTKEILYEMLWSELYSCLLYTSPSPRDTR